MPHHIDIKFKTRNYGNIEYVKRSDRRNVINIMPSPVLTVRTPQTYLNPIRATHKQSPSNESLHLHSSTTGY